MEDYQRRKLYRVHLKNISEIKNSRSPQPNNDYCSRLFNFNNRSTYRLTNKESLEKNSSLDHEQNYKLTSKKKWHQQKEMTNFLREKENIRLGVRLLQTAGSINMKKYQKQYHQHKKIMNLHRKVKKSKRAIMYRIYDITFKGVLPNLYEQFTIFDISSKEKKQNEEQLLKGNIFELRKMMIKGFRDQILTLKIEGRVSGSVKLEADKKMVPIMWRKQIVGNVILQTF